MFGVVVTSDDSRKARHDTESPPGKAGFHVITSRLVKSLLSPLSLSAYDKLELAFDRALSSEIRGDP
jgi:hypothetical protein